jgi:two-component system chemotaxis response regulator CheY
MKNILIVDDASTVRLYYRQTLEQAGYAVNEAVNGLEALEKAFQTPYNLYVVDVNMPKLDGYAFLKKLRGEDSPQAPAIMVSTEARGNDMLRAFEAGANLYLVKPVKPDQLLTHIRMMIGSSVIEADEEVCS